MTRPVDAGVDLIATDIKANISNAKELVSKVGRKNSKMRSDRPDVFESNESTSSELRVPSLFSGRIAIPAGPCPFTPTGYKKGWNTPASDEVIVEWANKVNDFGQGRYAISAVVYWIRNFWDINGPEYSRVSNLVEKALQQPNSN